MAEFHDKALKIGLRLSAQMRRAKDREAAWTARYALRLLKAAAKLQEHLTRLSGEAFEARVALEKAMVDDNES